jgi:hypothetical protein
MGDKDGVDQVKIEDDGVMARDGGQRVKSRRKAKASSLVEVRHASTSEVWWFHPQNHRCGFGGLGLETIGDGFTGLGLKT